MDGVEPYNSTLYAYGVREWTDVSMDTVWKLFFPCPSPKAPVITLTTAPPDSLPFCTQSHQSEQLSN